MGKATELKNHPRITISRSLFNVNSIFAAGSAGCRVLRSDFNQFDSHPDAAAVKNSGGTAPIRLSSSVLPAGRRLPGQIFNPNARSPETLFFFEFDGDGITAGPHKNQAQKHGRQTGRPQHQAFVTDAEIIKKIQPEQGK